MRRHDLLLPQSAKIDDAACSRPQTSLSLHQDQCHAVPGAAATAPYLSMYVHTHSGDTGGQCLCAVKYKQMMKYFGYWVSPRKNCNAAGLVGNSSWYHQPLGFGNLSVQRAPRFAYIPTFTALRPVPSDERLSFSAAVFSTSAVAPVNNAPTLHQQMAGDMADEHHHEPHMVPV